MTSSSGYVARRVQANVYYTDSRGVNHSIKVKTAVLGKNGECNIEIEPDEEWKKQAVHSGIALQLGLIGQELPVGLPLAKAVAELVNREMINARYADERLFNLKREVILLVRRPLVQLSLFLKPYKRLKNLVSE